MFDPAIANANPYELFVLAVVISVMCTLAAWYIGRYK